MSTVLFLKHGLLSGTKMSTTVRDAKLVNEQWRHTLDFRKRGTYNWISVQKQASRISKLEFNHKTKKFENLKKRKGTPLPFGSKVKFERNREQIVRKQGTNYKDWDWEWDWRKRSELKFEESGFRTYEQSESGEFFERWYSVSVSLFSNVRSDKKVFKKIYKKDMEKKCGGNFSWGLS